MSDLVGNPKDQFFRAAAHMLYDSSIFSISLEYCVVVFGFNSA